MHNDITGIVLSGGKSRRMGINKSFLKLGNKFVIEIITGLMSDLFSNVLLIANEPWLYRFLGLNTYEDIHFGKGPLAGIHSGLTHSKTEKNFVISCDIPLITKQAIEFVINYPSDKKIKVPFADSYVQQLCGMYSKNYLPLIEEILNEEDNQTKEKKCLVLRLLDIAGSDIINIEKKMNCYEPDMFLNMNAISQYKKVESIYEKRINCRVIEL